MNIGADLAYLVVGLSPTQKELRLVFVIGLLAHDIDPDEWNAILNTARAVI